MDGKPIASNGLSMSPTVAIVDIGPANIVFVCGGVFVEQAVTTELIAALRRLAQRLVPLGSLCTGGYALAKAGLLDKYKAVVHWENMSALKSSFRRCSSPSSCTRLTGTATPARVALRRWI
jgi:transcriptional regulator GlxA family with amidase domain